MESVLGLLLGGVFRFIPEGIKLFDRKNERAHEKDMFNLQLEADRQRSKNQIAVTEAALGPAELEAIIEATKAQAAPTGIKWVDALSSSVRPIVTYLILGLYIVHKIATLKVALLAGTPFLEYAVGMWGAADMTLLNSILGYWFVDRTLRKQGLGR